MSVRDGTRTVDFLEDRAAKYLPQANTIQANADFRVFTDMVARWRKFYGHVPSAEAVVEAVCKEWFQQQLVEAVIESAGFAQVWQLERTGGRGSMVGGRANRRGATTLSRGRAYPARTG